MNHSGLLKASLGMMTTILRHCDENKLPPIDDQSNPFHFAAKELQKMIGENIDLEEEYEHAVAEIGDMAIENVDLDERDFDEQIRESIHSSLALESWVQDEDKAITVLRCSNHPSSTVWNNGKPYDPDQPSDDFPFSTFAYDAMEDDIREYLNTEYGFKGPLTKKAVQAAKRKLAKR